MEWRRQQQIYEEARHDCHAFERNLKAHRLDRKRLLGLGIKWQVRIVETTDDYTELIVRCPYGEIDYHLGFDPYHFKEQQLTRGDEIKIKGSITWKESAIEDPEIRAYISSKKLGW